MSVDCSPGFSFLLRGHLWVIIVELPGSPNQVVAVSLTSKKHGTDETVVLRAGDHRFIRHDTVVSFADARAFVTDDLINRIELRFFQVEEAFHEDLVKRMRQGLLSSPFTPQDIKRLCATTIGQDGAPVNTESPPATP